MNRPALFLVTVLALVLVAVLAWAAVRVAPADEAALVTIRLLDPRVVSNTAQTMDIGWRKAKTDIIASRTLTKTERERLTELAEAELSSDDDVPFCGHHPAYAILYRDASGKVLATKTLCGLCMTWASGGDLYVIKGKETLDYLNDLLPIPAYFADVKKQKERVVFADNKEVPYHQLQDE